MAASDHAGINSLSYIINETIELETLQTEMSRSRQGPITEVRGIRSRDTHEARPSIRMILGQQLMRNHRPHSFLASDGLWSQPCLMWKTG
jgi:hypothetical protein